MECYKERAEIKSKRAEIENQTGKQPNLSIDSLPLAGTDGVSNLNQTTSDQSETNLIEEGTNQTSTLSLAIIIQPRNDEIEGRNVEESDIKPLPPRTQHKRICWSIQGRTTEKKKQLKGGRAL
jgi:hypothetical protein